MSSKLPGSLRRFWIPIHDEIGYGQAVPAVLGMRDLLRAGKGSPAARATALTAAFRRLPEGTLLERAGAQLRQLMTEHPDAVADAETRSSAEKTQQRALTRTTVLKTPGPNGERGVIFCLFEYNWSRLLQGVADFEAFTQEYDVIWGASWSNTSYLPLARALATSTQPVHVHTSNLLESNRLRALDPRIRIAPTIACEYLNPAAFRPRPANERDIDLLVVANWAPFKRHWELFRAMRDLPRNIRVVCIGQPEAGYTLDHVKELSRLYGVRQEIEYFQSIPPERVREMQERSRAATILSRREGHCMAAAEALFAGASLGMRRGAHVGPAAYVNEATGLTLDPAYLGRDLGRLIEGADSRMPHEWALANLGYQRATARLNDWLATSARERGLPWTRDIVPHWHTPYPWVGDEADRATLAPAVADLHRRYPETFRADLLDVSRH